MGIKDWFAAFATRLSDPAENIESVTKSDTVDLANVSRALIVGVAGDVAVITKGGQDDVIPNMQPGVPVAVRVTRVKATGTAAGTIKSLY